MKVKIIRPDILTEAMFTNAGWEVVDDIDDADLIQLTGGADIDPVMYNQSKHITTRSNSNLDLEDMAAFSYSQSHEIPIAGICRGAQMINVLNGGSMYQDVNGHLGSHNVFNTRTQKQILCSSTHHQQMIPNLETGVLAGVVNPSLCGFKDTMKDGKVFKELDTVMDAEVVLYKNSLCFQPHPEHREDECRTWYFDLLEEMV